MTYAMVLDNVTRGYLASNQLSRVQSASDTHLEATVATTLSIERRKFSWLWDSGHQRALLVNRLTGTLFDPESGQALNAAPRLLEAPIAVPKLKLDKRVPAGVFSTSEPSRKV